VKREDVVSILQSAAATVDEADLDADLRPVGFTAAVSLLAGTDRLARSSAVPTQASDRAEVLVDSQNTSLDKIAIGLDVDRGDIDDVFTVTDDGRLDIIVGAAKLPRNMSEATRDLVLLVTAGRQLGGWDAEWTASEEIRDVCRAYGVFQSKHFSETLSTMHAALGFSGKGPARKLKLLRPGRESTALTVERFAGSSRGET
jgi:hypothetical protein